MNYQTLPELFKESSETLTNTADRELMERLLFSMRATEEADWDRSIIALMLAKLGKMSECREVIDDIKHAWEKADAMQKIAVGLFESKQDDEAQKLLDDAQLKAIEAQSQGTDQDQQCASGVLADISEIYANRSEFESAETVIQSITHPVRQQRAMDRLKELRGDPPEQREDY